MQRRRPKEAIFDPHHFCGGNDTGIDCRFMSLINGITFVAKTKKEGEGVRGIIINPSHSHLLTHLY